jgi:hypothetical protein
VISKEEHEAGKKKSSKPKAPKVRTSERLSEEKVRQAVWAKWCPEDINKGKCFCCEKLIDKEDSHVEFGHIIAKCKGGPYTIDNIRPVCIKCNHGKGGMHQKHMYEFMITKGSVGLKHLMYHEKKLYLYNEEERTKIVYVCKNKLNVLLETKVINKNLYIELKSIVDSNGCDNNYVRSIDYILSLE